MSGKVRFWGALVLAVLVAQPGYASEWHCSGPAGHPAAVSPDRLDLEEAVLRVDGDAPSCDACALPVCRSGPCGGGIAESTPSQPTRWQCRSHLPGSQPPITGSVRIPPPTPPPNLSRSSAPTPC